ncbi:hypothetical protein P8C59_004141 [Phyllachora maydis]|uniref:DNA/RNA-binding protein Alba-like domain-containing protein n=1 Tax=Phyllachora maydis TaxID=1825666 RepID=A0AAD9I3F9_9PEZI|nr:hypothetical protein P8C59_004141 [Phyllachora maydis]
MAALGLSPNGTAHTAKRKQHHEAVEVSVPKKQRVAASTQSSALTPRPLACTLAVRPHEALIAQLSPYYDVKTLSIQPSTKISTHVDKVIQHLGRFNPMDVKVLPGVVLLYSKHEAANKLVTISETVRRRIGEAEQEWYLYNVLRETETSEETERLEGVSVVEDTVAIVQPDEDNEMTEDADDGYYETMGTAPTVFEQAIAPVKTRRKSFLSVFISRVPVAILSALSSTGFQTNEAQIDHARKKKMGVV